MYKKQSKNLMLMNILQILQRYSDEDHRLTQQDILKYLEEDYEMKAERKSVKRNIENLIDEGYQIEYEEKERGKGKDKNTVTTGYYIIRDFDNSELRLLIDAVLFSKYIPASQRKDLIKKLEAQSNIYFKSSVQYIKTAKEEGKINPDLFYNIDIIDEAIKNKEKISFAYCTYDENKKLIAKKDENGKDKRHTVSPYHMVAANGRYYLICKYDTHDGIVNVRIDRIKNIKREEGVASTRLKFDLDLSTHMVENLYMMAGNSEYVTFLFNKARITDVMDWFGTDIILKVKDENTYEAQVKVNLAAMKFWSLQYGDNVKVLSPKSLVDDIKKSLDEMQKKYK